MPVVDASVVVEFLAGADAAEVAARRLREDRSDLWAPHLLDAEVGHAFRGLVAGGELSAALAQAALDDLGALPVTRVAHAHLMRRAWRYRHNLSFYDALYVALAEELDTRVVTFDARLAAGAPNRRVELLAG